MQFLSFAIMVAVLGYNIYGVLQVGPANASTMQWVVTGVMAAFVALRVGQMLRR